jgi:hypothetical protein
MASRRRFRYLAVALTAGGVVLLTAALVLVLRPDRTPHPERLTARVTGCDVSSYGAAQVTFTITNDDRRTHGYRVDLTVVNGTTPVGAGTSLITRVEPGSTATGQALVPLTGSAAEARCVVRANAHDGGAGRH